MTIFWNLQNELSIITWCKDIESRALGKSYPMLKYPTINAKFKSLNFRKQINLVVLLFIQKQFSITIKYVSTINWMWNACWKYANNFLFL